LARLLISRQEKVDFLMPQTKKLYVKGGLTASNTSIFPQSFRGFSCPRAWLENFSGWKRHNLSACHYLANMLKIWTGFVQKNI
jgi:hypothetical protein